MARTQGAKKVEKSKSCTCLLQLTACELVLDRQKKRQEADDFPATDDGHQGNWVIFLNHLVVRNFQGSLQH